MIDWERLEQEIADARNGERLAERIVTRARRRRLLRSLAVATAVLAGLAVLAVPLALTLFQSDPRPQAGPLAQRATAAVHQVPSAGVRAEIYAAALSGGPRTQPLPHRLWVRDHVCFAIPTSPSSAQCTDAPIARDVRRQVVALLGPAVRFSPSPPVPERPTDPSVVAFGRLRLTGDRARLPIETLCGRGCGEGETLVLRRHDGRWQVSGTAGPRWVS